MFLALCYADLVESGNEVYLSKLLGLYKVS
jgi:hypothetical protein